MTSYVAPPPPVKKDTVNISPEAVYHQIGDDSNKNNSKYVSPSGKKEAVYDAIGNLVTDPVNVGTYNIASPFNKRDHFAFDVVPYYMLGISR